MKHSVIKVKLSPRADGRPRVPGWPRQSRFHLLFLESGGESSRTPAGTRETRLYRTTWVKHLVKRRYQRDWFTHYDNRLSQSNNLWFHAVQKTSDLLIPLDEATFWSCGTAQMKHPFFLHLHRMHLFSMSPEANKDSLRFFFFFSSSSFLSVSISCENSFYAVRENHLKSSVMDSVVGSNLWASHLSSEPETAQNVYLTKLYSCSVGSSMSLLLQISSYNTRSRSCKIQEPEINFISF